MSDVFPVEVKLLESQGRLDVTWSDDHVSPFPLRYLRAWCPCAVCQGHFTGEYKYIDHDSNIRLLDVQPVGNYAMKLVWSDGHDTGIYQFDYLRRMCPSPKLDPNGERLKERVRNRREWGF